MEEGLILGNKFISLKKLFVSLSLIYSKIRFYLSGFMQIFLTRGKVFLILNYAYCLKIKDFMGEIILILFTSSRGLRLIPRGCVVLFLSNFTYIGVVLF